MDNFFNKGFKGAKCKTLLKLAIPRIKLLRNRREIQLKNMRRDIAKLLETGQEATARIRVEHIIREENMMAAQEIIGLLCELIVVRLPIIETQKECPLDLKEAISSVCFAARRCSDLPELQQVEMLFAMKYGKEFVSAATELMPNCGVNRQIIELLSIRPPSPEVKLKLLKEIADEHDLDWDPSATETEFLKPHEDLLNGPTQFISGLKLPLPKEKHNETFSSAPVHAHDEQSDSDLAFDLPEVPKVSLKPSRFTGSSPDMATPLPKEKHNEPLSSSPIQAYHDQSDSDLVFDSLDFPEVQKVSLNHSSSTRSSAEMAPPLPTTSPELEPDLEIRKPDQDITYEYYSEPKTSAPEGSVPAPHPSSNISVNTTEDKQFIPFACPPLSSASFSMKNEKGLSQPGPTLLKAKSEAHIDLQDVLAAAHAAAESAERAAAAARSAASLAQLRISKLVQKRNEQVPDNSDNTFQMNSPNHPIVSKSTFDQCNSLNSHINASHSFNRSSHQGSTSPQVQSHDSPKMEPEIGPGSGEEHDHFHQSAHLPQRLSSLEDDPYFSYPNLFSSPDSIGKSGVYSSEDNLPSIHKT